MIARGGNRHARSNLHALGLRYRVCARPLTSCSGQPVSPWRFAVASGTDARSTTAPSASSGYWTEKVQRNQQRDAENELRLRDAGWHLEVVWEHEDLLQASQRIAAIVRQRRQDIASS